MMSPPRHGAGSYRAGDRRHAEAGRPGLLKRSPVMLPIPGAGKVAHLTDNAPAAALELSDEDFAALDQQARAEA